MWRMTNNNLEQPRLFAQCISAMLLVFLLQIQGVYATVKIYLTFMFKE